MEAVGGLKEPEDLQGLKDERWLQETDGSAGHCQWEHGQIPCPKRPETPRKERQDQFCLVSMKLIAVEERLERTSETRFRGLSSLSLTAGTKCRACLPCLENVIIQALSLALG